MDALIWLAPIARKRPPANVAHLMLQHWHRQVWNVRPANQTLATLGLVHQRQFGNCSDVYHWRGWFAAGTLPADLLDGTRQRSRRYRGLTGGIDMARAGLLWLLGIPIPILLIMWALGWL